MKNDIIEYLKPFNTKQWKWKIKDKPEYIAYLNEIYPDITVNYQLISIMQDKSPYCNVCNKPLIDIRKTTCSHVCRIKQARQLGVEGPNGTRIQKQKQTLLEKYGTDTIQHIDGIKEKRLSTMMEKYGTKISHKSRERIMGDLDNFIQKSKQTIKERYNVDNISKLPSHKTKIHEYYEQRYGCKDYKTSPIYIKEITDKQIKKTESLLKNSNVTIISSTSGTAHFNRLISYKCNICDYEEHDIQRATILVRLTKSDTICAKCSGITQGSQLQKQIFDFIQSIIPNSIVKQNTIIPNSTLQMDIFIPDMNIAIEFDGLYWHNDQRHDKNYHLIKTNLAEQVGIQLIHIFEDEWIYRENIVKSRLRNLLKKNINIYYARKCELRKINQKEQQDFLLKNHIQGYALAHVGYGLYDNNQLISLMTFSKPSKAKGQQKEGNTFELLRFCNVLNTTVIGAANKLLKAFEREYKPNKILSFADRRWSQGHLYTILNFKFISDTRTNYWYFKTSDMIRHHRFMLRKNKTDDPNKTEYENRIEQGWLRIWDCGSKKYIKEYKI